MWLFPPLFETSVPPELTEGVVHILSDYNYNCDR